MRSNHHEELSDKYHAQVRSWEEYLFMGPLLKRIDNAEFMYKAVPVVLRGCAAATILASLAVFFSAGKMIFGLPSISAIFGGIMFQLMYIFGIYAVAHVLVIRARDISRLSPQPGFMLPMSAVLLKMIGEAYAFFVMFVAFGSGVFIWFTGLKAGAILGPLARMFPIMSDASFMGGIEIILTGMLISIGSIIVTYILSELLVKLSDHPESKAATQFQARQISSRPREISSRIGNGL